MSARFDEYRTALGAYGATLASTPTLLDDLARAAAGGWSMRELAAFTLNDWPAHVRSASGLIRARVAVLADTSPPRATPTPPRYVPQPRDGKPMPDDIKAWLTKQPWWR